MDTVCSTQNGVCLESVMNNGLVLDHFCKWARNTGDKELSDEITLVFGIRHAKKKLLAVQQSPAMVEASTGAMRQHASVLNEYQKIMSARITRIIEEWCLTEVAAGEGAVALERCPRHLKRLVARVESHIIRHLDEVYLELLSEIAARLRLGLLSTREALANPELLKALEQVVERSVMDALAVAWVVAVYPFLHHTATVPPVNAIQEMSLLETYVCNKCLIPAGAPASVLGGSRSAPEGDVTEVVDASVSVEKLVSVLDHLEEWIKLSMTDAIKPFEASVDFAHLRAKEWCDPERLDTSMRDMDILKSKGIQTLIFDFDRTMVEQHIGGVPASKVGLIQLTPTALTVVLVALANGLRVAVASWSDKNEQSADMLLDRKPITDPANDGAYDGAQGSDHILCGEAMIRAVLDNCLGAPLSARIQIVAGHPEKMTKRGVRCSCGTNHPLPYSKHYHIHRICPELANNSVRASSIMFFDDNQGNTVRAMQEGVTEVFVYPPVGISWGTWIEAMQRAETIMDRESSPFEPWSFQLVQQ